MAEISIIMPVYNTEDILPKTFASVLSQTFKDFELLAVCDGPTDRSGEICDSFSMKDKRVRTIHTTNKGSWSARNVGIEASTGKYLFFMDSDDWMEINTLEGLYALAESNNAELVVTGFCNDYEINGKQMVFRYYLPNVFFDNQEHFRRSVSSYLSGGFMSPLWNKLFLREKIMKSNIRFINKRMPDHYFCMDYMLDIQKVVFSSVATYHWRRSQPNSNSKKDIKSVMNFNTRLNLYEHTLNMFHHWGKESDETVRRDISTWFIERAIECIQMTSCNQSIKKHERKKVINNISRHKAVTETVTHASPRSKAMKLLTFLLKRRYINLLILSGYCIGAVHTFFPKLFFKLKEKAVHQQ